MTKKVVYVLLILVFATAALATDCNYNCVDQYDGSFCRYVSYGDYISCDAYLHCDYYWVDGNYVQDCWSWCQFEQCYNV